MAGFLTRAGKTITGGDDIAASWRALSRRQRSSLDVARSMVISSRGAGRKLPTSSTDPAERFDVALAHYGVDDGDLVMRARTAARMFYLCTFIALLAVGACAGAVASDAMTTTAISLAAIAALMVAHCLRYGHAHWQIRTRRLGSVREYVCRPSAWLPGSEGGAS